MQNFCLMYCIIMSYKSNILLNKNIFVIFAANT